MSWKMALSTLSLLISIRAKVTSLVSAQMVEKLRSGQLDKTITGWDQSEAPALAV
jgi:hypothetical protein